MEIKNGMHFVGNKNGREIVIINATPAAVTYRDLEHGTAFTVGRAMFERCDVRPESAETAPESTPATEWAAMSDADKFNALKAAAKSAIYMRQSLVHRCGNITPAELAGEAWIRLEKRLQNGDPRPLRDQLLFAALDALRTAACENVHSIGGSMDDDSGNDDAAETVNSGAHKGTTARPIEDAGAIMETINSAARDAVDRRIIALSAAGYMGVEIAAYLGMTKQAVSKRLIAIRTRITLAFMDDPESIPLHG